MKPFEATDSTKTTEPYCEGNHELLTMFKSKGFDHAAARETIADIWEATLNVANSADGTKILYDINPIKKVGQSVKSDTSLPEDSVAQPEKSVNPQFSFPDDPDTVDEQELRESKLPFIGEIL